jgi:hypothetical protein
MNWKKYTNDRLIAEHPEGFYVVRPEEGSSDSMPLFCPLCESIMKNCFDEESYAKFECCDKCASNWAYPNQQRWRDGWRPTAEELSARNKH